MFIPQCKKDMFLYKAQHCNWTHSQYRLKTSQTDKFFLTELIQTFLSQLQQCFCEQSVGCRGCTGDYQKPNPEPSLLTGASLWGCHIWRFSVILYIFLGERNWIIGYTQENTLRISLSILVHVNLLVFPEEFFLESSGILTLCKCSFSDGFAPIIGCSFFRWLDGKFSVNLLS